MPLIAILVLILIMALAIYVVGLIPLPAPWSRVIQAIIGIIFLILILQRAGLV